MQNQTIERLRRDGQPGRAQSERGEGRLDSRMPSQAQNTHRRRRISGIGCQPVDVSKNTGFQPMPLFQIHQRANFRAPSIR